MSFLKKLGKIVNKVTDFAAPIAGYVPGIGPIIAGGLDTAGDLAGGHNLKDSLLSGLKTGGSSYLGGKLAGKLGSIAMKGGVKGAIASALGGKGTSQSLMDKYSDPSMLSSVIKNADGSYANPSGDGSSWQDRLGSIVSGVTGGNKTSGPGGIDWGKILGGVAKAAPAAIGAYQASKTQGQADDLRNKALKMIEAEYAQGAPLRSMGLQGMTDPRLADVSGIFNQPRPNYQRINV